MADFQEAFKFCGCFSSYCTQSWSSLKLSQFMITSQPFHILIHSFIHSTDSECLQCLWAYRHWAKHGVYNGETKHMCSLSIWSKLSKKKTLHCNNKYTNKCVLVNIHMCCQEQKIHGALRKTQEGANFLLIVWEIREGLPQKVILKIELKRQKELVRRRVDERAGTVKTLRQ